MKKLLLLSLVIAMHVFSFNALGDTFCGVECNSDNNGKYLACPGTQVEYKWCKDGTWRETFPDGCNTRDFVAPIGYLNIGKIGSGEGFLVWVKKGTMKTGNGYLFDDYKAEDVCFACRQGFKLDVAAAKCVKETETVNGSVCKPGDPNCNANPRTPQLAGPCDGSKKQNDACSAGNHATKGRCRLLSATKNGVEQMTCAATECENGYLLWLNKNGNSQGICHSEKYAKDFCSAKCSNCNPNEKCVPWIVDTPSNLKINEQTLVPKKNGAYKECHCEPVATDNSCAGRYPNNAEAQACCELGKEWDSTNNTCECGEGKIWNKETKQCEDKKSAPEQKPVVKPCSERYPNNAEAQACCELGKEWDSTNNTCKCGEGKIWNKETKQCEDKKSEQPGEDKDCFVTVSTNVKCKNGKTFSETNKYKISKEKLGKLPCGDLQSKINNLGSDKVINDLVENYKQLDELINEICKTDGNSGVVSGNNGGDRSMTLAEAKDILDRFFDAAENNANVWKTEEGKFNSARLASDLTAGVVLGTVGGVVSANLIKKNQIKKGYEVLHCTIGGQTVADWGDEFNTSLRR